MLFKRQKLLLNLLGAIGGEAGAVDFQKLLFLFCREEESEPSYEFVPHKFGCYSFTSAYDRKKLMSDGWLAPEEKTWKLAKPAPKLGLADDLKLRKFAKRTHHLRGDELVRHTYKAYPATAWRSEIRERVLSAFPQLLNEVEAARPGKGKQGLATIGYEGKSLESYLNALLVDGVSLLCDVRRNPLSRRFGFSRSTLRNAVESVGIRYEHLPALGIASEERKELATQSDYDALFKVYRERDLPKQRGPLQTIANWVNEGERVALTCFELHPHQCHRHCVADNLQKTFGFDLKHL